MVKCPPPVPPTKYTKELEAKIAEDLTCNTIKKTCEINDICEDTYYRWMYLYPTLAELSTKARKIKAVKHFVACEDILEEVADKKNDADYRSDLARIRLDFHLRLAGKANQGLFGDKVSLSSDGSITGSISVPKQESREDWLKNQKEPKT